MRNSLATGCLALSLFSIGFSLGGAEAIQLPQGQKLTPAGIQVDLPGLRPQVLALSPDGRLLVTSGKTAEVIVVDPVTGSLLQRVVLPAEKSAGAPATPSSHELNPDKDGQVSYTGLLFSQDGKRIYLSNVNGSIKVFNVEKNKVSPLRSFDLPPSGIKDREKDIPAGLALSADGKRLYVALNLSNRLLEMDALSGVALRTFDVGVAPYDIALKGAKAYVSNWGGRRPGSGDLTGPAGKGTRVRVDRVRHIANEGSVSVLDLASGKLVTEILVGLHPSAVALTPNKKLLVVANAGSDSLSVIDTRHDSLLSTESLRWHPGDFFGASPNALAFDPKGKTLYVCHGTQNAVAVLDFKPGSSKFRGLIPVGWYPGAVAVDKRRRSLYVANIKGIGNNPKDPRAAKEGHNSHQYFGTLNLVPVPDKKELEAQTLKVLENYRREVEEQALLPARSGQAPRALPERAGEPSLIKHVVYIIKENRTYDQVLGDLSEGNGDPSLCVFGEKVTPNQHKICREFALLDNAYCSGILSADGHQWADTAFATDYMEKSFAGFPRSYPDGMDDGDVDALAYSPAGFIWDKALAAGKSLRVYGEFSIVESGWVDPAKKGSPNFLDFFRDLGKSKPLTRASSRPAIESLRPYLCSSTVGWELKIPDQFRADQFIRELKGYEAQGGFPDLTIICLPNDHTAGTDPGFPTPAAQVADNDLAFGRILEALSKSRFWKDTCVFAIEDDPQSGWDHVSGYRTTAYVAGPHVRRHAVVKTPYDQCGMLRTMELILGLTPMNQMDATATPFREVFTDRPDLRPFHYLPSNVPLDQMNPQTAMISDPQLRRDAVASARLPLDQPDRCPEDLLNRILWRAQKGSKTPYPEWAISAQGDGSDPDDDDRALD
ncbi:MAG: beta-propeller fold lactonase family protein [candidate division FCPU426 bacterium]